jgi:methyltransferase (TIGR00027 family)
MLPAGGLTRTAQYIARGRALETAKGADKRLFCDPFADAFAGQAGAEFLDAISKELKLPQQALADYVAVRTKFLDNCVMDKLVGPGAIKQLVICAVGGDSRSRRLPLSGDAHVYELDLPETMDYRRSVFSTQDAIRPSCEVTELSVDLSADDWSDKLQAAGFDPSLPSFILIEGLLMYLTVPQRQTFIEKLSKLCCPGSVIAGDVLSYQHLVHSSTQLLRATWAREGSPILSGLDTPEIFFSEFGFVVTAKEFGQDETVDFGYISDAAKDFYFVAAPRGKVDVPRNFLFYGCKSS